MEETTGENGVGVRRLPIVCVDGEDYFLDMRLREFRTVTPPIRVIEFIGFDSEQGKRMLEGLMR